MSWPDLIQLSRKISKSGSFTAPRFLLLALALSFVAILADQMAAPILYTSSPLWATATGLFLIWRRGKLNPASDSTFIEPLIAKGRLAVFIAVHLALVLMARSFSSTFQSVAGTLTVGGSLLAMWKLSVLAPTLILFPLAMWRKIATIYFPEAIAGLVVLLTFFPLRLLEAGWPWYGQALGRFVHTVARLFVPGLGYVHDLNPTLVGPQLDVTIIMACSGINGLKLFDYLFCVVTILDWNRLRKGRALFVYFTGLFVILLGNAVRIISLVVFGNHGFAELISRFQISAGWIYFSLVFLIYLFATYGWMLDKRETAAQYKDAS